MTRRLAEAEVVAHREIARDTFVIRYAFELDVAPRAGQFAMVHPGSDDEYVLPRPFSILDHADGQLEILVKVVGRGSAALARSRPGDRARLFAPLGTAFDDPALRRGRTILVAGGVGIVPLHLLARERLAEGAVEMRCLFGARAPSDLPLPLFERPAAGRWELWVERGATADLREGLVTRGLEEALREWPDAAVATCGPTPMMQAVVRLARERGARSWVCLEEQMGCGAGVCRACVVEDARETRMRTVCKEGPVFAADAIRFLPEEATGVGEGACP